MLDNLKGMNEFLGLPKPLRLNQEEINHLSDL